MNKKFVRNIGTQLLILLLSIRLVMPAVAWADDITPTDTPTPIVADQSTVNNSASSTNSLDSSANTGSNTTAADVTPTPTEDPTITTQPTDSPTPTDTPTPTGPAPTEDPLIDPNATASSDITASNDATVTNTSDTTSNSGNNTTSSEANTTDTSTSSDSAATATQVAVQTGDAVSVVAGGNTINTTSINSDVSDQTINIFGDQTGDIDLSTLFQLVSNIISQDNNNQPVINVQVTGVNNYAYLSNTVVSTANTGNNTTTATGDVIVQTGNAESVVSLINKVNLTVVNSSLHMVTINIFGHLTGNIILPTLPPLSSNSCTVCGVSFNANNQAVVTNTVNTVANAGSNITTASDSSLLTTGNAASDTNIVNLVNTNVLGSIFSYLFVNDMGLWNGSFLGWGNYTAEGPGTFSLTTQDAGGEGSTLTNTVNNTSIHNDAYINNTIVSLANTGGNTTEGQHASVVTGNAYSAVSLINLVNTNFFHSLGFFGFLNIFGTWDGNLGGKDTFLTPTPTPASNTSTSDTSSQPVGGGQLSIENSNNVGAYVLPGDTITFFINTKNVGSGPVFGTKLTLNLIADGQNVGGTSYDLGDIQGGRVVKLTTGLVLSQDAAPGNYIAEATVTGTDGNGNQVNASAESIFTIFGNLITTASFHSQIQQVPTRPNEKAILGASTNHPTSSGNSLYLVLVGILLAYLSVRVVRARKQLVLLLTTRGSLTSRLHLLKTLLL